MGLMSRINGKKTHKHIVNFILQNETRKVYFLNHLADSARRRLKRKLLSIQPRKKMSMYVVPIKSYSDFDPRKSPYRLPGIYFVHEKNAFFVITGSQFVTKVLNCFPDTFNIIPNS